MRIGAHCGGDDRHPLPAGHGEQRAVAPLKTVRVPSRPPVMTSRPPAPRRMRHRSRPERQLRRPAGEHTRAATGGAIDHQHPAIHGITDIRPSAEPPGQSPSDAPPGYRHKRTAPPARATVTIVRPSGQAPPGDMPSTGRTVIRNSEAASAWRRTSTTRPSDSRRTPSMQAARSAPGRSTGRAPANAASCREYARRRDATAELRSMNAMMLSAIATTSARQTRRT